MIRFITAYRKHLYRFPKWRDDAKAKLPKNINVVYYFPESVLTEVELVEWAALVVNDHTAFKKFGQTIIYSNSEILYHTFRALIAEKSLRKEDFMTMFYTDQDAKRQYKIRLDDDGRHEWIPRSFMRTYADVLMRIL